MPRVLEELEPKRVFYYFEEISRIPRGSGNTKAISDYLVSFAKEKGLSYIQDEMNNVLIRKPAAPGYENVPTVILQGHMDMVCEKRPEIDHDFTKDPLELVIKDGYVWANGTTLGGDDGIAVAFGLALLEDPDLKAPALEVLITVDEEIGLLGADGFDCKQLNGKRLINLDSEEDGVLWVSCAGGRCVESRLSVKWAEAEGIRMTLTIDGLVGGHSGSEIDKNRANANVLMGRVLYALGTECEFALTALSGGSKDNVITNACTAEMIIAEESKEKAQEILSGLEKDIRSEYEGTDGAINIRASFGEKEAAAKALQPGSQQKIIFLLMNIPWSVQKMSGTIEDLVETSANPGVLKLTEEELSLVTSVRSSKGSAKIALSDKICYLTEFLGGEAVVSGDYPAWEYKADSYLRDKMVDVYRRMYGQEMTVKAIHAGLECGLFYERIEDLDCVSLGPDILDIHTAEEHLDIESTRKGWEYLKEVLASITE
ncbi:MAG: aminoacyl-histidine dipeptidase [Blautia sp.]|nr:aminoacyl-histidine dipeptidase [Blautia sp.]